MWPPILSILVWLTAIMLMILQCMRAVYGNDRHVTGGCVHVI